MEFPRGANESFLYRARAKRGTGVLGEADAQRPDDSLIEVVALTGFVLAQTNRANIVWMMATISEIEAMAFELTESQRATLAAHLLESLPSVLFDEDEGIAEALRRDAELDANPASGLTLQQLDDFVRRRRT